MSKNVILYLTSPNDVERSQMGLANFKQLEKLGYDIVVLTTTDLLDRYIYSKAKCVIHDYTPHKCDKKTYLEFYQKNKCGYYYTHYAGNREITLFHDTYFPSVLRNFKTLVNYSEVLGFDKYFYVEDDHFFHDDDLKIISSYFDKLNEFDSVVFSFKRYPDPNNSEMVYCSYFHFGKTQPVLSHIENIAYTSDEFKTKDEFLYLNFFEAIFTRLMSENSKLNIHDVKCLKNGVTDVFPNSKLNQIYSYWNVESDTRCGFVLDPMTNDTFFFYGSSGLSNAVNFKVYIKENLIENTNLNPGCWIVWKVEDVNDTIFVLNDKFHKKFESYNGIITNM